MSVANKLTPEIKSKTTEIKHEHRPQQFQDKTLQLLVPNSKRLGGYTGDTQERKDLHITSCLHGTKEGQTSTRQIKKGCQHKDLYITSYLHGQKSTRQIKKICQDSAQNCLQGKDERKTKYSAIQVTLTNWTNHPRNKQGIRAEKTLNKNLHSKEA